MCSESRAVKAKELTLVRVGAIFGILITTAVGLMIYVIANIL